MEKAQGEGAAAEPQNLYSAIPGLVRGTQIKRSIKGCVPRICHLRITRIEALAQLTSSKTEIKVAVVMNDGRSRLRSSLALPGGGGGTPGVRAARLKRAALSSAPMLAKGSAPFSIPVNIDFYMQYFHNLRAPQDTFRILLQKKSKRVLNKVVAETTVVLSDVLQAPLDEGSHLMLQSTGRLRNVAVNTPLVRLHAQLESLALETSDVTRWWPSDKADDIDDGNYAPNLDGICSGEEIEEEDWEEEDNPPENADDDDEWVENHQIISASINQDAVGLDVELDTPRSSLRAKMLKGTIKMAKMTLHPIRAFKTGFARMRSRRARRGNADVSGHESEGTDDVDDFVLSGEDCQEDDDDEGLQWVAGAAHWWLDVTEDDGTVNTDELGPRHPTSSGSASDAPLPIPSTSTLPPSGAEAHTGSELAMLGALTENILRQSDEDTVIFLNTGNRRGALLHSWIVSVHKGSTSGLWSKVVPVPGVVGIRAALGGAMAHRQALDQAADAAGRVVRIVILGGDLYTHNVVREWLRQRTLLGQGAVDKHKECAADNQEGLLFYVVPLGARGRETTLALQLSARDPNYADLFLSDRWGELWEALTDTAGEGAVSQDSLHGIVAQIEETLIQYLQQAHNRFRMNIAEVFVEVSDFVGGGGLGAGGHSEIVRQHTLPFISNLTFRGTEHDGICSPKAGGVGAGFFRTNSLGTSANEGGYLGSNVEGSGFTTGAMQVFQSPQGISSSPLPGQGSIGVGGGLQKSQSIGSWSKCETISTPVDLNLDFWVGVGTDFVKTSSKGSYLDVQLRRAHDQNSAAPMVMHAVSVRNNYKEKNTRIRASVSVTERDKVAGGGCALKAEINRLICTTSENSSKKHFAITVDGVRVTAVKFVSVSPHLSASLTKTFPVASW